jgi:hypothetical protein
MLRPGRAEPTKGDRRERVPPIPARAGGQWYAAQWYAAQWYAAQWFAAQWYAASWYAA